jgi:hypothetical protein
MFEHPLFHIHEYSDVPMDRDVFLMDERWMAEWEAACISMFSGANRSPYEVGYISHAAVRSIVPSAMELSWYPNTHTRFHELRIILPRAQFLRCVGCDDYDVQPYLFIKRGWLSHMHLRAHSVFALVDAVGVKRAILDGALTRRLLVRLRKRIDTIAQKYRSIVFISFADSILLKSNWFVGQYNSRIKYDYDPELFIKVIHQIKGAYEDVLGLSAYAVLAQGSNEYFDDTLMHVSNNHISLNSLGLPFAQLLAIENAARGAIRAGLHAPADLYMDEDFFHSLSFRYEFASTKNEKPRNSYQTPMGTGPNAYFYLSLEEVLGNLKPEKRRR